MKQPRLQPHKIQGVVLGLFIWMTSISEAGADFTEDSASDTYPSSSAKEALTHSQAIVQLQGLKLPPPQVQGDAIVPMRSPGKSTLFTIEAQINQQSEPLLVDTGASTTLLSNDLVHRLQLQGEQIPGDRLASAVAGGSCLTMDAHLHHLPSFMIGKLKINQLQGLEFINTQIPEGVSAVLGMNLLSSFDLKINPETQRLALVPPTRLPAEQITVSIPLQQKLGVMLAQIWFNHRGPFTFLLDTGAASTFVSPQLAQLTQLTQLEKESVKVKGFCGLESAYRVQVPQIQIGQHKRLGIDAVVVDSAVLKTLGIDGILGQNVLNQFEQHWRFPKSSLPETQAQGSLTLTPLSQSLP